MRTKSTLLPNDRGARQLSEQYGEHLVCVRYRYDEQQQKRFKTVELIIKCIAARLRFEVNMKSPGLGGKR